MNKILCSTGAITGKTNGYDYKLLEPLSKQLLCDGFELMMDSIWYEDIQALKKYLQEVDLFIPVVHCEKDIGEMISKGGELELSQAYRVFEIDCDVAKTIGANNLVLHLWGGCASDSNFQNNSTAYPYLDAKAKEYGLELLIENVVCNVENPMKHLYELKELYPNIRFVFDTKMAAFHEQLELLYEPEYEWLWKEGYIQHYHINDYAGGYMDWRNLRTLPVGKGKIDFKCFFEFIKKTEYVGNFTAEGNAVGCDGMVDVDMLNEQFMSIREYIR
ncbi:MAG: sugar phosphate isomerase/epimerase [Lachnospiraceae bacterium]|nr:sugar phosphate isomerase/epimerase [Lachnospiraceae bacterium]